MRRQAFRQSDEGSTAVDFALVAPAFFILVFGVIAVCALYYSQAAMHMAAEAGARYWAVSDSGWTISSGALTAPSGSGLSTPPVSATSYNSTYASASAQTYAKTRYLGVPLMSTTFTGTLGTCGTTGTPGFIITGVASYNFNVGFWKVNVPVSSTACYPEIQ